MMRLFLFVIAAMITAGVGRGKLCDTEKVVDGCKHEAPLVAKKNYKEIDRPTPNYSRDRKNDVVGVILHHTAEPTVENALAILTSRAKGVGAHVVIDTDGTRYIMAKPTVAVYHAGLSILNGRESCNYCTVGIEFQGNTVEAPLTEDQIASGIEYLLPIMAKYKIPLENVVTHEMVRTAYMQKYPKKRCKDKVDITPTEYQRFMKALRVKMKTTEALN
jgi:N-acetyl-anhydromuramyl-L-alanine amidase AmpD